MPILNPESFEFISRSAEQTRRVGMRLGAMLQGGDVICLVGDLGSGKTTFTQGVAVGWGSLDSVTSPTFVLVNVYRGANKRKLYHLDAYRLNTAGEALDLDIDSLVDTGPLIVEWADRIQAALPKTYLQVALRFVDTNQRDMVFQASGLRYQEMVNALRRQMFGLT